MNPVSLDAISDVRLMNRIEIKYVFSTSKLTDLVALLGKHYHVLEICNMRILPYSTTYLDTEDYLFYNQHVRGEFDRHKIRYRKYEATEESFLEIKKKTNKGRTIKWRIADNAFIRFIRFAGLGIYPGIPACKLHTCQTGAFKSIYPDNLCRI